MINTLRSICDVCAMCHGGAWGWRWWLGRSFHKIIVQTYGMRTVILLQNMIVGYNENEFVCVRVCATYNVIWSLRLIKEMSCRWRFRRTFEKRNFSIAFSYSVCAIAYSRVFLFIVRCSCSHCSVCMFNEITMEYHARVCERNIWRLRSLHK